jgi:hypothetical protein
MPREWAKIAIAIFCLERIVFGLPGFRRTYLLPRKLTIKPA